ncbi:hypothetical protein [Deinococcus humi]|uniref:Phospholipase D-like domain-containing protein n=1 Tax=Deinococcus humi TaxID=662880 RepID=A0A7W8JZ53_9DEIO|nr:hypothetical protein [Deinococcus humi]MBB5365917.1 hypothetical protein [Deinococcus humi]GGO40452.1 hypothetical protein GCM10008949_49980 [Deinococcus humi]
MRGLAASLVLAALSGVPQAQPATVSVGRVVDLMGTAQRRVLVYVPYLTDTTFAEAIRAAKVDRTRPGLQVMVVTIPFFAAKENALTNALALAGVAVIETQVPGTTAYVLVDDHLFSSAQIGRSASAADVRLMGRNDTNTFLQWFRNATRAGETLTNYEAFNRLRGLR